jgi:hypothetical protein
MLKLTGLKELDLRGIIIGYGEQKKLNQSLSATQIYYSAPCNCAK